MKQLPTRFAISMKRRVLVGNHIIATMVNERIAVEIVGVLRFAYTTNERNIVEIVRVLLFATTAN